jgi:hypothetical protein
MKRTGAIAIPEFCRTMKPPFQKIWSSREIYERSPKKFGSKSDQFAVDAEGL